MDEISKDLAATGLLEGEVRVYLALLKGGSLTLSSLKKRADCGKKEFERSLSKLLSQGLITKRTVNKKLLFTARDPKRIVEILDDRNTRLTTEREKAIRLIEPLRLLGVKASAPPELHFFAGQEGVRAALEDTLSAREKTLRAFVATADFQEFLGGDFIEQYTKKRIACGLNLQIIRTFERDKPVRAKRLLPQKHLRSKDERLELRFVNDDFAFPATLFVYDSKLLFLASKDDNFGVVLESKELSQLQKKLFDLTWRSIAIRSIGPLSKGSKA